MLIYKYEVPNKMIFQYCKIITMLEKGYNSSLECARRKLHDQIFDYVGCNRSCVFRDDRRFLIALANTVCDLTYEGNIK